MSGQAKGAVGFLFTDIEGSTRLWELEPDAMRHALRHHDEVLAAASEVGLPDRLVLASAVRSPDASAPREASATARGRAGDRLVATLPPLG